MQTTYRPQLKIIFKLVGYAFLAGFFLMSMLFYLFDSFVFSIALGMLGALGLVWLSVIPNIFSLQLSDTELILKQRGKKKVFERVNYQFSAKIKPLEINSELLLYLKNAHEEVKLNCEFLAPEAFDQLCKELGIKAEVLN